MTELHCIGEYNDGPCGAVYTLDKYAFPLMVGWSIDGTMCPSCCQFHEFHKEDTE